jgi:hypothetical protein
MGKVPIWAQWLMIAVGVLLIPVFVVFLVWFLGWSRLRRLWPRRKVAPGPVLPQGRRAGVAARG